MTQIPYLHVAQAVYLRPWAIQPEVHSQIRAILKAHVERGHLAEEEIRDRMAAAPRRVERSRDTARVARIPIHGVIIPRASFMAEMSGATSCETIRDQFRAAMADDEIDGIVFDVNSPGGLVDGVPELAAEIRAARGRKPMAACAYTIAASAAYWLAVQADELTVTQSGEVGSIGVWSAHEDWSKFWDEVGVVHTLISAGKFKVEGNEFEPLPDETKAHFQSLTDDYYGLFTRDVAAARSTTAAEVRDGYGQGRMLTAKRAVAEKLADRIATLEETEARIARQGAAARTQRERQARVASIKALPPAERFSAWAAEILSGRLTRNDVRAAEGLPPVEGWDAALMQSDVSAAVAITDRQVELEEEEATTDPDHDDGNQVDVDEETPEATSPPAEYYALRARRRDRVAR